MVGFTKAMVTRKRRRAGLDQQVELQGKLAQSNRDG